LSKGKSLETHNTAVFSNFPALSLNFLTEAAQVQCQYLEYINHESFPAKSLSEATERSFCINLKSANCVPTFGSSPEVCISPNKIDAMVLFFVVVQKYENYLRIWFKI
jgi:hypothetical protein